MSSNLPTIEQALHIAGGGGTVGHTESNGKARRLAKEQKISGKFWPHFDSRPRKADIFTHEGDRFTS